MAITQIYCYTFILLFLAIPTGLGIQEVCQWEKFEAMCQEGEVVMIKEAHYGRLGVGHCQPRDFGFAGCSADVSNIMHTRCSGRQHCRVPIPDPVMFAATPCPKDLVTYLQADYECVKVAKWNAENCDDQILMALNGDIAKSNSDSMKDVCPHRILAQPGQTVNVYLYDFYDKDSNTEATGECITYGYVSEGSDSPTKICGGNFRKNHLIYTSDSNVIDIMLADPVSYSHHYLLHYEVIGCPTLEVPPNAWVKVEDNTAVVMCNFSHIASNFVCSGNEWVGNIQNCTSIDTELLVRHSLSITSLTDIVGNSGMFAVICVGLACGILVTIGVLALIKAQCFKAKQMSELPQTSIIEKTCLPQNENSFKPVDEYQPVYVPITMGSHVYAPEDPQSCALSSLHGTRLPLVENSCGPLNVAPMDTANHSIYNITGLMLNHNDVITLDNTLFD